jgi:hypothetical protein
MKRSSEQWARCVIERQSREGTQFKGTGHLLCEFEMGLNSMAARFFTGLSFMLRSSAMAHKGVTCYLTRSWRHGELVPSVAQPRKPIATKVTAARPRRWHVSTTAQSPNSTPSGSFHPSADLLLTVYTLSLDLHKSRRQAWIMAQDTPAARRIFFS